MKRKIGLMSMLLLSCFILEAMEEQSQNIETVEELQRAAHDFAKEQFDKGNLLLFDGADGANQCHINALMVNEFAKSPFDTLKPDHQLFLVNNILRSIPLHLDKNDAPQVVEKLFGASLSRGMKQSLKSGQSTAVSQIKKQIIDSKRTFFNENLVGQMGVEWDTVAITRDNKDILPKFIGIKSMLEYLKGKDIWTVLKCKSMGMQMQESIQTLLIHPDQQRFISPESENVPDSSSSMPVMVIEGKAHVLSSDVDEHRRRLQALHPEAMQLTIAASWMEKNQKDACSKLFGNVKSEHEGFLKRAHEQGLSADNQETFFIQHMFLDRFQNAVERNRLLSDDPSRKNVLQEVGIETD